MLSIYRWAGPIFIWAHRQMGHNHLLIPCPSADRCPFTRWWTGFTTPWHKLTPQMYHLAIVVNCGDTYQYFFCFSSNCRSSVATTNASMLSVIGKQFSLCLSIKLCSAWHMQYGFISKAGFALLESCWPGLPQIDVGLRSQSSVWKRSHPPPHTHIKPRIWP